MYGATEVRADFVEEWTLIAELSFALQANATVTAAELESCLWAVAYLRAWSNGPREAADNILTWEPLDTSRFNVLQLASLVEMSQSTH